MEKYLKRAKLQKNIAIGCLIFAFIALFAIMGDDSGESSMITGTVAIVITAMVLLAFSYNNIKKTQRMDNAGDAVVMAENSGKADNTGQKKTFLILGGVFVAFFAMIVIMAVFVDTSDEEGRNESREVGEGNSSLVIPYECDTGAIFNVTLSQFCNDFDVKINKLFKDVSDVDVDFKMSEHLDNIIEAQTDYETNSGCKFTLHSAFVYNQYYVGINEKNGKVSSISISFDYDDNSFAKVMTNVAIQCLAGVTMDEGDDIGTTLENGILSNTVIYKDGVLLSINVETVSYSIMAASEEFVKKLEDSGECNVIYWK